MTTLVISPHCDDAELGCGGYLSRLRGNTHIEVMGASNYARTGREDIGLVYREERLFEQDQAALILKATCRVNHLEENNFGKARMGDVVSIVEKAIKETAPHTVFIPLPSFNQDHQVTWDACMAALRPHRTRKVPFRVMAYENPGQGWGPPPPVGGDAYIVLTENEMKTKIKALRAHRSQFQEGGKAPFSLESVAKLAAFRGAEIGQSWAEKYQLIRAVF